MRKLAAYPRQNQVARALDQIGQLEKTVFILELLLDPELRRRQERGLNDGEAVNAAAHAIFLGQRGEFRDRADQDQVHRASCLHLVVAANAAWMTPYLADAIGALIAEGEVIPDELIAHLSPVIWEPVNFLGQYRFDPASAVPSTTAVHYELAMTKARRPPNGAMGIAIHLEDQHANVVEYVDWPTWLDRVLPPYEDASFQCLRFIDPCGDTVFNRVQMPTLLGELERLTDRTSSDNERQQLAEIARLAKRCSSEAHLYLRFYGD